MGKKKGDKMANIRLTEDWVFRYVYGSGSEESNRALIALLNTVLDRKDDPIVSVTIINPATLDEFKYSHEVVMDIRASTETELIDIEMQMDNMTYYKNRALFNGSKLIKNSLVKGQSYGKMKKSIVISFVNNVIFHEFEDFYSVFETRERRYGTLMTDRVEFHFIELGKLDATKEPEDMTSLELFSVYLKYLGDPNMKSYTDRISRTGEEVVVMSKEIVSWLTEDQKAQMIADMRDTLEHDIATRKEMLEEALKEARSEAQALGHAEGLEEGRAKGLAEGYAEARAKLIIDLLKNGDITEETAMRKLSVTAEELKNMLL